MRKKGRLSGRNTYRDAFRRCVQDAGMKLNVREAGKPVQAKARKNRPPFETAFCLSRFFAP